MGQYYESRQRRAAVRPPAVGSYCLDLKLDIVARQRHAVINKSLPPVATPHRLFTSLVLGSGAAEKNLVQPYMSEG